MTTVIAMAENQDFVDLLSSLTRYLDSPLPSEFEQIDTCMDEVKEMEEACQKLAATTRTLFGPLGLPKLVFTSKEYKMLLNGIVVEHPVAKLLVKAAKDQQEKVGDGANLVVLIAWQHIKGAKELMELGMDPRQIIDGYKTARDELYAILRSLVDNMDVRNADQVIQFMKASFISSIPDSQQRHMLEEDILCPLIAEACIQVCPENPVEFNVDNVRVARLLGKSLSASETFRGMVLKDHTVAGSIKGIHDAKVLVIDGGVDTTDSEQLEEVINASHAKVIVSGGRGAGLGQKALRFCDDNEIMVLKIDDDSEFACFCRTTNAAALLKLGSTIGPNDIGHVDSILVEKTRGNRVTVKNKEGKVVTVLLGVSTAATGYDGLCECVVRVVNTYRALCSDTRIVPGAGATEFEIARQLRSIAATDESITKYADSFNLIPLTLAQNADITEQLRPENIWDRYTTKKRALKIADVVVLHALNAVTKTRSIMSSLKKAQDFIVSMCKKNEERKSELVNSLNDMLSDEDFKKDHWLGEVVEAGDAILGLSPKGYLYSCNKVSRKVSSYEVIDILPAPVLDDYSYIFNSYIITRSDRVKTNIVVPLKEKLVKEFTLSSNMGNCTMYKFVEELYIDTHSAQSFSTPGNGRDVCITRCDIVLRWCEGKVQNPVETKMEDGFCMLRASFFDISVLNDKPFIKEEESFPLGKHNVKWLAERMGRIVKHQLNINVVCIPKIAADWEHVRKVVSTLQNISHTSSNVLMVHDVQLSHNVFHFAVESFGTPLTTFMKTHAIISHKKMLKLIRGLVNGIRALHINNVPIGNLNKDDIFVDDNFNVKIAPIKFQTSAPISTSKNRQIKLIKKEIFTFADLEADKKADMIAVGEIIFWCYTKKPKYNDECLYYPLVVQAPKYVKEINTYVVDLLNKLLHPGLTAIDAAAFYIFWTEEKTLDFIRAITERLDSPDDTLRKCLYSAEKSILGTHRGHLIDWRTKFPPQFMQIMKTDKHGVLVDDKGTKDQKYEYKGKSVYHMYQIIRNLLAHENSVRRRVASIDCPTEELQEMFDTAKGFCSFLLKSFPNMIREPYHILKAKLHEDHRFTKFYKQVNLESE